MLSTQLILALLIMTYYKQHQVVSSKEISRSKPGLASELGAESINLVSNSFNIF